jgi:hypothetical protein
MKLVDTEPQTVPGDWPFVSMLINGVPLQYHIAEEEYRALLEWYRIGESRALTLVAMEHPSDRKVVLTIHQGSVDMISRGIE